MGAADGSAECGRSVGWQPLHSLDRSRAVCNVNLNVLIGNRRVKLRSQRARRARPSLVAGGKNTHNQLYSRRLPSSSDPPKTPQGSKFGPFSLEAPSQPRYGPASEPLRLLKFAVAPRRPRYGSVQQGLYLGFARNNPKSVTHAEQAPPTIDARCPAADLELQWLKSGCGRATIDFTMS